MERRRCKPGQVNIKWSTCCRDIGPLAVCQHHITYPEHLDTIVYISPRVHVEITSDIIHCAVAKLQTQHPEALISGNFNHIILDKTLPSFSQNCTTRGKRTIDPLFADVKDAYSATPLPALGKAHSLRKWSPETKQEVFWLCGPVLFTLYTMDFKYNLEFCHVQKFADYTSKTRELAVD